MRQILACKKHLDLTELNANDEQRDDEKLCGIRRASLNDTKIQSKGAGTKSISPKSWRESFSHSLALNPPELIADRYRIASPLGSGGFGVVYLAIDTKLNREVAVKIPLIGTRMDQLQLERFHDEARSLASMNHPAVVTIHEADLESDPPYIVSEYCDGPDLNQWILYHEHSGEGISIDSAVNLVRELAEGVQHAHQSGIVHRDIKPSNILLASKTCEQVDESEEIKIKPLDSYQAKLADFGLAKWSDGDQHRTQSSMVVGTPLFMSPEQAAGQTDRIGPATDVFALGAVLYRMLTGNAPFDAKDYSSVIMRLKNDQPEMPHRRNSSVSRDLQTICMKCLRTEPFDRYASAIDLADDLKRFSEGQTIHAKRATSADKIRSFVRRETTFDQACLLILILCVMRIIYAFGTFLIIDNFNPNFASSSERFEGLLFLTCVTLPFDAWTAWMAIRNRRRRLTTVGYNVAISVSVLWAIASILSLFGVYNPSSYYARLVSVRVAAMSMISLVFLIQTAAWYVADHRYLDWSIQTRPAPYKFWLCRLRNDCVPDRSLNVTIFRFGVVQL